MTTATSQDTLDHILGAGALTWSWWRNCDITQDAGLPGGWQAAITGVLDGKRVTATITHGDVLKTARQVLAARPEHASDALVSECRNLLFDADEADFDAVSSDELLQLAVFGRITYG